MDGYKKIDIQAGIRIFIISATLGAILLFGLSYVIINIPIKEESSGPVAFCEIILPGDTGSMTKVEPLGSGKSLLLTIPAVIGGFNFETNRPGQSYLKFITAGSTNHGRYAHLSTTASISSKKAMEFTLVGAKPSGTG